MRALTTVSNLLERILAIAASLASWCLLALILVTVAEFVAHMVGPGSRLAVKALQGKLLVASSFLVMGSAYLRHGGKGFGVLAPDCRRATSALREILGTLLISLPFCVGVGVLGVGFARLSWLAFETSPDGWLLARPWSVKGLVPAGMVLVAFAALVRLLRAFRIAFGSAAARH
jgi:TRAP-type mannitol/chloroaromatic compound transport system permease small subunit